MKKFKPDDLVILAGSDMVALQETAYATDKHLDALLDMKKAIPALDDICEGMLISFSKMKCILERAAVSVVSGSPAAKGTDQL